jgi:ribosomal protein S18 acetylase RimI-like enzyme
VIIRECTRHDLDALEAAYPSAGLSRFHEQRYLRQQAGVSSYLTIWDDDGTSVGSGEIMWTGAKEAEVRKRFPGCPELNGLTVWPADRRSHGVGTRMIEHATRLVQQRGFAQVGLGVDDDNPRAAALYLKLGFAETGVRYLDRWASIDRAGSRHDFADPCRFLVKQLQTR